MNETTLATFRVDKETWESFKQWASERGSNASTELNQFILRSLGRIDSNTETRIDNNIDKRIDSYLDNNLDKRIDKAVKKYLDNNLDKRIDGIDNNIDNGIDKDIDNSIDNNLDKRIDNSIYSYIDKDIDNNSSENALESPSNDNQDIEAIEEGTPPTEALTEDKQKNNPINETRDIPETPTTQGIDREGLMDKELAEKLTAMGRKVGYSAVNLWRHGKSTPSGKNKDIFKEWEVRGDRWFRKNVRKC
jgi:hypothetical protein